MSQFRLTPEADDDLANIWLFIAQDDFDAADRVASEIISKFDLLAENPRLGRERPEFAPELRSFAVHKYIVFYRPGPNGIEVVRVLHGARDIERIFGE